MAVIQVCDVRHVNVVVACAIIAVGAPTNACFAVDGGQSQPVRRGLVERSPDYESNQGCAVAVFEARSQQAVPAGEPLCGVSAVVIVVCAAGRERRAISISFCEVSNRYANL